MVMLYALLYPSAQRRDSGWIHTLLEEAENERMHLMCVPALISFRFLRHMFAGPSSRCGTLALPFARSFSQRKAYFTTSFVRYFPGYTCF